MQYTTNALGLATAALVLIAATGCSGKQAESAANTNTPAAGSGSSGDGSGPGGSASVAGSPGSNAGGEQFGGSSSKPPGGETPGAELSAHDLSVLFPLSGPSSRATLWPATLPGAGGELLPLAVFESIGASVFAGEATTSEEHAALRVVGVRFDPCFGSSCQPQVRLVLQSIDQAGVAADGAVHALYNLDVARFTTLVAELRELSRLAPENQRDAPLGISPALLTQGPSGAYSSGLKAIVTRYAGAASLGRVTFMTRTNARQPEWGFGGLDVGPATPEPVTIPALPAGTTAQDFSRTVGVSTDYRFAVNPANLSHDALMNVLSSEALAMVDSDGKLAALQLLARVQNPRLENPDTTDCASCHFADRLRKHLAASLAMPVTLENEYPEVAALDHVTSKADTDDNLRAFGYFDTSPVVSRRTANETHEVSLNIAASYP